MSELQYHPKSNDPAFEAGCQFAKQHMLNTLDIRQAFWCGIKWAREQRSLPVVGKVTDDGITWSAGD